MMASKRGTVHSGVATQSGTFRRILKWREFWLNLALTELNERFRRSYLGVAWLILHPLAFTVMLCAVFGLLSQQDPWMFSNYVFIGIVVWNWFSETITLSSQSLINAQAFMKQAPMPIMIFPLKTWLVTTVCFCFAFTGVLGWYAVTLQQIPNWSILLLLVNIPLMGVCFLPYGVAAAVLGTLYRDFQQAIQLVLQGLWFVSPVFVDQAIFARPGLREWDAVNPISAMLSLVREPLLAGSVPTAWAYILVIAFGLFGVLLASVLLRRHRSELIHYV